ncbi:hypothetical protein ACFP81_04815 [Deinococcus lacus]|uniref:DUF2812 domain-containing protein n=1 Tax=Deinococcus lacus TaxID=392561 RepID=A0ABW1YB24_9DEIO
MLVYLRSITTVHLQDPERAMREDFWRELLPTWTFLPAYTAAGGMTPRLLEVAERVHPAMREDALSGFVLLLEDVDRPSPNECLITVHPGTREATIRIFGRFLTDVQSTSEWFMHRLLGDDMFVVTPHTRCFIAMTVQDERIELTTGHLMPQRYRVWRGFYRENIYNVNITLSVLAVTLLTVLLVSPSDLHSPLGKAYGVAERVLTAAMMNAFLLLGQFYAYRRGRRVVEWEKP